MSDQTEQSKKVYQENASYFLQRSLLDGPTDEDMQKETAYLRMFSGGTRKDGGAPADSTFHQSLSPQPPPSTLPPPESAFHDITTSPCMSPCVNQNECSQESRRTRPRHLVWTTAGRKSIDISEYEPNRVFPHTWDGGRKPEAHTTKPASVNTFLAIFGGASTASAQRELARRSPPQYDNQYTGRAPNDEEDKALSQNELPHTDPSTLSLLHRLWKQFTQSSEEDQEERSEFNVSHHVNDEAWSSESILGSDCFFSAYKSDQGTSSASGGGSGDENRSAVHGITTDSDETPRPGMTASSSSTRTSDSNQRIRQSGNQDESDQADTSTDSSEERGKVAHKAETRSTSEEKTTTTTKKKAPPDEVHPSRQRVNYQNIGSKRRRDDRKNMPFSGSATSKKEDNGYKNTGVYQGHEQSRGKRTRTGYPKSKTCDTPSAPSSPATHSFSSDDISLSSSDSSSPAERASQRQKKERTLMGKKNPIDPADKFGMERLRYFMKESEQTQSALQEWDKKNGLPKSHSQTMVNTSRSRRQLQEDIILPKWDGTPLISNEAALGKPRPRRRNTVPLPSTNVAKDVVDNEELLVRKKCMQNHSHDR